MNEKSFRLVNEDIKLNCLDAIADIKPDGKTQVIIKEHKDSRSLAQLRLKWLWMTWLAKNAYGVHGGKNALQWNRYFKGKFLRPLLLSQSERYQWFYKKADSLYKHADNKEFAKEIILDNIKTEWLSVENMQQFMSEIDFYVINRLQLQLPIPDDLTDIYKR